MKKRYSCFVKLIFCTLFFCACSGENPEEEIPPPIPEEPKTEWTHDTDPFTRVKGVALLDLTTRNKETEDGSEDGRNLYSAGYMLEVAGVPCFRTANIKEALDKSGMILFSSPVRGNTFTAEELEQLTLWVTEGGVIVSPACIEPAGQVAELFGITAASYTKSRYFASWEDGAMTEKELEYMDEPEEKDFSLGNERLGTAVKTYGYTPSTAEVLARFNTGESAVTVNKTGRGRVYSFGLLWRDVIQRPQLNKDFSAQRSYSNDFEPSADVFPLFVRSVYTKYNEVAVWKSTVPGRYRSVLIPTHDCDSRTAYDEMHFMSDYEKAIGVKGHYFLTTHYYRDQPYMSAFYDESAVEHSRKLVAAGHTVGSHSVGHFPDFNKTERFPIVRTTRDTYKAMHDLQKGITTGGFTWAEVALSKEILESDLGIRVRSFRTGHLLMNKNIPAVQEDAGYSFSSCYGAGDVMTCFPFLERIGNEWTGRQSKVLQMPLHFSDVINDAPMDETNWHEKPDRWLKILNKLAGNYAPAILLIHPNREWKMSAEKLLIDRMDQQAIGLYNFEDYGDFWSARRELVFEFAYVEEKDKVMIRADRADFDRNTHLSFMIETESGRQPSEIVLVDENAFSLPLQVKEVARGKFLAYR